MECLGLKLHIVRFLTVVGAFAVAVTAFCQSQVQVTSVYSIDYHSAAGVPEVGDPFYGVAGNFTITGAASSSYIIRVTYGNQVSEWDNVVLGTGDFWWWASFDASLEGPIPVNFSISTTGSSSSMSASLPVNYPTHAIEFIDAKQMNASEAFTSLFQPNTGILTKLEYIFGEPQITSSQGPTISYSPPTGAKQILTQPLGIPLQQMTWLNQNTATTNQWTAQESVSTTLHDSRVNPNIMRTVPWSAVTAPQPPDVAMWQQSELFVPTNAPEIADIIANALPANYATTMTPWDAARAVYATVVKSMTYNDTFAWDPLGAYDRGSGACGDFSYLFAVSLRSLGFATHVVAGWRTGTSVVHVWAEFYMPGVGWVPADATDSNGIDPTGTYLYHFGSVPDLNTRFCVSKGGNCTWPDTGLNIPNMQVPSWWYWSNTASNTSSDCTTSLLTPTDLSLVPATASIGAGGRMFAHVELQTPAPTTGTTVYLTSNSFAAQVPAYVAVSGGSTITTFPITIGSVTTDTVVTITAISNTTTQHASFTIHPITVAVSLDQKWYASNSNPQVSVTLSSPSSIPTVIGISSDVPGWGLPTSLTIPAGSTTGSVAWPLPVGAVPTPITVIAKLNNQTDTDTALSVPRPIGLFFPSTSSTVGSTVNLTVRLASPAPSGGVATTLSASSSMLQLKSASVTIPAGATSVTVPVIIGTSLTSSSASITATSTLGSATVTLTILPSPKRL